MKIIVEVIKALNRASTRHIVVGGVATLFHGHTRFTADLDLILDLHSPQVKDGLVALKELGFSPVNPVELMDILDSKKRQVWIQEKNALVLTLNRKSNPFEVIDIFLESPIDFEEMYSRSSTVSIDDALVTVCSIKDLIFMKEIAGRDKDLLDLVQLYKIRDSLNKSS